MTSAGLQRDLIFLVADRNIEAAIQGVLGRHASLQIRPVSAVVRTHPQKDPGCYLRAHDFLGPFQRRYGYAMVVFDREGCGKEHIARERLESDVEERLAANGWPDRSRALVIDPELEAWVWSDSPHVDTAMGWAGKTPALRRWLIGQGLLRSTEPKPPRPKEAVEAALRQVRKPRSSAIYRELADKVGLERCIDPAFLRLKDTLQQWFPQS